MYGAVPPGIFFRALAYSRLAAHNGDATLLGLTDKEIVSMAPKRDALVWLYMQRRIQLRCKHLNMLYPSCYRYRKQRTFFTSLVSRELENSNIESPEALVPFH